MARQDRAPNLRRVSRYGMDTGVAKARSNPARSTKVLSSKRSRWYGNAVTDAANVDPVGQRRHIVLPETLLGVPKSIA